VVPVVEHLLSKQTAMSSNRNIITKQTKRYFGMAGFFNNIEGKRRSCLNIKKTK
jgi:hypothetical protein